MTRILSAIRTSASLLAVSALMIASPVNAQKKTKSQPAPWPGPVTEWPRVIPARVGDTDNRDLFIMTLGEVSTPLAQGKYDPVNDRLTLNDGSVMEHYYRDTLQLKFYKPINKTIFPLPPSGLCTWYYYYQHITDREIRLNTDWIAENLKSYGSTYVQIDDGWQAETAAGRKGSRDWTGFDKNFAGGMKSLAEYIKSKGLVPGIWIAPHGQSNEEVVKANPGVFILKADGTSASKTWEGDWLIDPTSPQAKDYFHKLFSEMVSWGYDYYKIDGQPIVVDEFAKLSDLMTVKGGAADSLYRVTLDIVRDAIGPNRYLLGCWGLPVEGAGIMDGSRTGGDVVLGWDGFFTALDPTMRSYYQHNIMWYTDPDVMLLRQPLTVEQARVWATLQGLTGQALMSSDRLMDLSAERVDMMKKVYPAVDIRPLDLFSSDNRKRIWDLKVSHLGRNYDVTGLFNFGEAKPVQLKLNWEELGISSEKPVHVFDYWNSEYLGAWETGMAVDVAPTSVRVVTLLPDNGSIQLISTSRHITQGWVDLRSLTTDMAGTTISGVSTLPAGDDYRLHFVYPRGKYYRVSNVTVKSGKSTLTPKISNHQGWAAVSFTPQTSGDFTWSVTFEPDYAFTYAVRQPEGIRVSSTGIDAVRVEWRSQYYLNVGYQVYLDGKLQGYTAASFFDVTGLDPMKEYSVDVRTVWDDGTVNQRTANDTRSYDVKFTPSALLYSETSLADLSFKGPSSRLSWPVTIDGKRYDKSIGMMPGPGREYDIRGVFSTFRALVAVDDNITAAQAGQTVTFVVSGDGKELWRSAPLGPDDAPLEVEVAVGGVRKLMLSVEGSADAGARRRGLPANWARVFLIK
ncbi:MAG TPA: NPCBM/NEW2 domain-containing protein [Bacteroidales bacterium]|nr:NPCBM/NEW2 domain-containing protein [Bacteroidales bacterium]